jgi:hypothetical protein
MNANASRAVFLWLSLPLTALVVIAGYGGLFWPAIYSREMSIGVTEARATDTINIVVAAPVLVLSAVFAFGKSTRAHFVWMGTLLFLIYNFVIYAFDVHFNGLFLVYCAVLGLSFYALLASLKFISISEIAARYGPRAPARTVAVMFLLLASFFAFLWFREIIPALWSGVPPKSVADAAALTNPVHVLDLSFVLPAYVIAAIALLRRKPVGIVLAPVLLAFGSLMFVAIAGLAFAMNEAGLPAGRGQVTVLLVSAAGFAVLFLLCLRRGSAA